MFMLCRRAFVATCLLAGAGAASALAGSPATTAPAPRTVPLQAFASRSLPAIHGGGQAAIRQLPDRADRDLARAALAPNSSPLQDLSLLSVSDSPPAHPTLQQAAAHMQAERDAVAAAAAKAAKQAKAAAEAKAAAARLAQLQRWVRPNYGGLSSPFGRRWGRMHEGIDLAGGYGSQILAATSGTVIYAGPESGYGRVVKIVDWDGTQTWYGHMSSFLVHVGQHVTPGQPIALVGAAGDATGPHLHFEVRIGGAPVDPIPFLAARGVHI